MLLSAFPFASRHAFPTIKNYPFLAPRIDVDVRPDSEFRVSTSSSDSLAFESCRGHRSQRELSSRRYDSRLAPFSKSKGCCEIVEALRRYLGALVAPL